MQNCKARAADCARLEKGEGGVFALGDDFAIVGFDDTGLLAAADDYAARAPVSVESSGRRIAGHRESGDFRSVGRCDAVDWRYL